MWLDRAKENKNPQNYLSNVKTPPLAASAASASCTTTGTSDGISESVNYSWVPPVYNHRSGKFIINLLYRN